MKLHGTFEEFRYQVASFYGPEKAIFIAASTHWRLHSDESVGAVNVDDGGPVPVDDRGFPKLGEDWLIDRYEW